ncbi:MAG: GNAT family N-acetyltransferase [Limimaricola sp.]|uniref:GNAT family N-acetyltransferase n=1 Tax=Limimaricola sp. TaxID=2211665 RepID=UPI001DCDF231|nr:GNAT family N-acetyltransferase [Limimaricola sp.]MBI1418533.1 GNAT family N-acetyltransferase [Limimaricola sp.]
MTAATIRPVRADDAPAVWQVFQRAVHEGAAGHYTAEQLHDWAPSAEIPEGYAPWLLRHHTLVADEDGQITGFFMLEESGYLNMAFVLPERRGSGLAARLYEMTLAHARAEGMTHLTVWASRMFHRFLRRRGWVDDPAPPPLEGHPIPTTDAEPIDYPLKLDLP